MQRCATAPPTNYLFIIIIIIIIIGTADVDECAEDNGGCEHVCTNVVGSYVCGCRAGHFLAVNGKNCVGKNRSDVNFTRVTIV